MSFWSSEKLVAAQAAHTIITPFDEGRVKHGAYEMTVSGECFVTTWSNEGKKTVENDEHIVIPPGQVALLLTDEIIKIPSCAIGLLSIKASWKLQGLLNVSGFHADPGWNGRLMFSVYNAGSQNVYIQPKQELFLIWFASLDRTTEDPYDGTHNRQSEISAMAVRRIAGNIASPGALQKLIEDQETQIQTQVTALKETLTWHKVIWGIILSIVVGVLVLPNLRSLNLIKDQDLTQVEEIKKILSEVESQLAIHEGFALLLIGLFVIGWVVPQVLLRPGCTEEPPLDKIGKQIQQLHRKYDSLNLKYIGLLAFVIVVVGICAIVLWMKLP